MGEGQDSKKDWRVEFDLIFLSNGIPSCRK